jgi:hypothetical protein
MQKANNMDNQGIVENSNQGTPQGQSRPEPFLTPLPCSSLSLFLLLVIFNLCVFFLITKLEIK